MKFYSLLILFLLLNQFAFSQENWKTDEVQPMEDHTIPAAPDYSLSASWAALPDRKDNADLVPAHCTTKDQQSTAAVDVFFIYPTSFTKQPINDTLWNASVYDTLINNKTAASSIKYQASIFNAAGRIYAPCYRQAHLRTFFTNDKKSAAKALAIAYADVKKAFDYYLQHYNNGRPIIIAAHSQGAYLGKQLLAEYFDGKPLMKQLVVAYLVGYEVDATMYEALKPCNNCSQTGCYTSWRTYATGFDSPFPNQDDAHVVCTNPLTWKTDTLYADRNLNEGAVLKNFDKIIPQACDAQIDKGILRINKPHIRGRFFLHINNYHVVDLNLFYMNVRNNAIERANAFFKK